MVAARPLLPPITLDANVASEQKEVSVVSQQQAAPTGAAVIDIDATLRKHIRQELAKIGARVVGIEAVEGSKKQFRVTTNATYGMVKYNPMIDLNAVDECAGGLIVQIPALLLLCATFAARPDVYGAGGAGNKYAGVMVGRE
jgi:hypothetical protein